MSLRRFSESFRSFNAHLSALESFRRTLLRDPDFMDLFFSFARRDLFTSTEKFEHKLPWRGKKSLKIALLQNGFKICFHFTIPMNSALKFKFSLQFIQNFNNNSQTWWQLAVKLKDWSEAMKDFIKIWFESAFVDDSGSLKIEIDFTHNQRLCGQFISALIPLICWLWVEKLIRTLSLVFKANKYLPCGFSSRIRFLSRCSPLIERLIVKLYSISVCDNPPRRSSRKNIYRSRHCRH